MGLPATVSVQFELLRSIENMNEMTAAMNPTGIPTNRAGTGAVFGKYMNDSTQTMLNAMYAPTNTSSAVPSDFGNHPVAMFNPPI
jgi:hypothetical protein